MNKFCNKCLEPRQLSEFHCKKDTKDGRASTCAICKNKYAAEYRTKYPNAGANWERVNVDHRKLYKKDYFKQNKGALTDKIRCKRQTRLSVRLAASLRNRMYTAIRKKSKKGSAVKLLGCTVEQFIVYLESKFKAGMSWDNWAHDGWHIDHKIPLSKFNLTDEAQLVQACHFTNLQPLWASDNMAKGNRYEQI